jgi:hypothetical protein
MGNAGLSFLALLFIFNSILIMTCLKFIGHLYFMMGIISIII